MMMMNFEYTLSYGQYLGDLLCTFNLVVTELQRWDGADKLTVTWVQVSVNPD